MKLTIAIAIATAGRRDVMTDTILRLSRQSRMADALLICPAKPQDFDAACLDAYGGEARVLAGPVGLPCQRNVLLAASTADVVVFFDDDFLPCDDYLAELELLFDAMPEVVIATGKVLADGILGPGLDHQEGVRIIEDAGPNDASRATRPTYNGYGCNMAVRMRPVRERGLRFDENLPLYAWLEDLDFSRQAAAHGTIVQAPRLRGVHLGVKKSGRSPGVRLGYSQVANPIYLARKGTMAWPLARTHMSRNMLANTARTLRPEAWVDRRGRLKGNLLALWDLARGRLDPRRILEFK